MNIIWHYLDKRSAVVDALKDYDSMQYIIDHTDEEIATVHDDLSSIGSPALSDMPRGPHNPLAVENRIIAGIDEIDVLKERYRQAVEYMAWFQPAWNELSEDERYVLQAFYRSDDERQTDAVYDICDHFNIERSSAYNKKNRAVQHLALLLYGK
jgi:hypothetical protein